MDLREKAHALPEHPGVYFLKDEKGEILYVGKAKRLNKRVISYFIPSTPQSSKNQRMLFFVTDFDVQLTDTELEALLLEQEMITKLHPPYNRLMNYAERYVYLHYDKQLTVTAKPESGSVGPFTMYKKIPELIHILHELYDLHDSHVRAPSAAELYEKRYKDLPQLTGEVMEQQIHGVLTGSSDALFRLQLLQNHAVQQQAFEWAQRLQEDKEILLQFQKQAQLLTKILEPTPHLIRDAASESSIKVFYVFQGRILGSQILSADEPSENSPAIFHKLPLPPVRSFIPVKEIDKCWIIAKYL